MYVLESPVPVGFSGYLPTEQAPPSAVWWERNSSKLKNKNKNKKQTNKKTEGIAKILSPRTAA